MAFDTEEILDAHDGLFAVSREEWEQSPSSMKRCWNDRIGSWNGSRRFSPMRAAALPFIR